MTGHQLEQAAHSPIGASSCERWWNCPGSVKLAKNLPKPEGTKYTATGTVAHLIAEHALRDRIEVVKQGFHPMTSRPVDDEIGRSYVEDGFEIEVDENMAEAVQVYIDTVTDYVNEYGVSWVFDVGVEVRFTLAHIDPEAFGTCDTRIIVPMNRLIVIDYKHGQGHTVEVFNNHQLRYYALGAYYELRPADRNDLGFIEVVIVQPRAKHLDGQVRRHVFRVEELLEFEKELAAAIARVRNGDTTLLVGTWCKFCNAKPVCPATFHSIETEAKLAFSDVRTNVLQLPEPGSLTPEEIANLIKNADMLKDWVKSVMAMGTAALDQGMDVPGFKLVTKTGNRRWMNEKDVEAAFALKYEDRIYNKKLKSPAQMEKVIGAKNKSELEPYWEVPVTGKTLTAVDDPREGVATGAVAAFAEAWQ